MDVSRWYGPVLGVNQVSLEIEPGITGLLGPNGAGKSTLMKLVTGQLRASIGDVRVFGQDVCARPSARRKIGFVPEVDAFYEEMTGRAFILAMARLSGLPGREARARTLEVLEMTGMAERADKKLRACSKGMRQRIKLAQALVHDPRILVLDEPLTGIDPPGRMELMALFRKLREEGKTVVVSTHILHEVEAITDRIVLMARGRVLASGTIGEIRRLLAEHPLTLRITCGRRRVLAQALVAREEVVGVAFGEAALPGTDGFSGGPVDASAGETGGDDDNGDLIVKVRRPEEFFRGLPRLVVWLGADVERVEALDASVEAVFGYLVGETGFKSSDGAA
ncbi:MAG TPA: ABC transporter ATP-binding protein [Planctomycetota bacterium]|nr:ABC transporter ATP-binding protein [Planctomycetota bacterium]